jgi:hypothetical protein
MTTEPTPENPEREALARLLFIADNHHAKDPAHEWEMTTRHSPAYAEAYYVMADAMLAEGYRKHVTIQSEMGLQALTLGCTVRDADGDVYRSGINDGRTAWWQAGPQGMFRTVALPAVVLHEPGVTS